MSFIGSLIRRLVERRAASAGLEEIRKGLETGGEVLAGQMAGAPDTPANREQAGHVIGIERWAANRLRSAINPATSPVLDEYDSYRPTAGLPLSALAAEFRMARAETLALIEALRELQDCRVQHNELGLLTVRGWLYYLIQHARIEGIRIR